MSERIAVQDSNEIENAARVSSAFRFAASAGVKRTAPPLGRRARQARGLLRLCALWLACMISFSACLPAAALERGEFGWRRSEAAGQRPLLVIWVRSRDDTPASELSRRKQYYEELIFGGPQQGEAWPERMRRFQPSVAEYFRRMSAAKFGWTRAGFVGPLTISMPKPVGALNGPPVDGKMTSDEIARLAITAAATQGHVDFSAFDTNHDGQITSNELTILVLVSGGNSSGQAARFGPRGVPIPDQPITYTGWRAVAGEGGGFMTYAHELFHTLGALDIYGPWNGCLSTNDGLSVMASTSSGPHNELSVAADAWHKMFVGWTEPRVVAIGEPGGAELAADHVPAAADAERKRPILIYDPRRGKSEFFLLEYRTPHRLGDDRNVVTSGLVIWHVAYAPDGRPLMQKSERPNCRGEYPDLRVLYVRGAPDFLQGVSKAYTSANGDIALRWVDGSDSGLRVTVSPHKPADPVLHVSWSMSGSVSSAEAVR